MNLATTMQWLVRIRAIDTSLWADDVWAIDSTPVKCGRSRDTTLHGLHAGFAITGAKADELQVLLDII